VVENPAESRLLACRRLTVPETATTIRSKVQDVECPSRTMQTYHDPDITTPFPLGARHRVGNGVVLAIDMAGVIQAVGTHERTEGD
jgi:hypothetical protein